MKKEGSDLALCDLAGYNVIEAFNGLEKMLKAGIITGLGEKLDLLERRRRKKHPGIWLQQNKTVQFR